MLQDGLTLLVVGILAATYLLSRLRRIRRRGKAPYRPNPSYARPAGIASKPAAGRDFTIVPPDLSDPSIQMQVVARSRYERVRLLNGDEARMLYLLERILRRRGRGHRLMAQVALAEVIRPPRADTRQREALAVINSKRLDFAIIDSKGMIVVAIEYQGGGHYHPSSFMRDAVKREALRKAGVPMIEITPEDSPRTVEARLSDLLTAEPGPPGTAAP